MPPQLPILPRGPDDDRAVPPMTFGSDGSATVEMPDEPTPVNEAYGEPVQNDDGSFDVPIEEDEGPPPELQEFGVNLAAHLPSSTLATIGLTLHEHVKRDEESREKRNKMYANGIKAMGVNPSGDDTGGAEFDGASRVSHPVLVEASIDFAASAIKELYPVAGPVRIQITGTVTKEKEQRARRKRDFLNWQLNKRTSYREHLETLLNQLPISGATYIKGRYDASVKRLRLEFVRDDEVLTPYASSAFYDSERITHVMDVTKSAFEGFVNEGLYLDESTASGMTPELTPAGEQIDKVEGKRDEGYNEDGIRRLYEVNVELAVEEDPLSQGKSVPYLITIDDQSQRIIGFYRNWLPNKPTIERLHWLIEFPLIPWPGQPIGLYHVIGSLSIAARGALRALLDSAHINNFPGGLKLGGAKTGNTNTRVNAGELTEIRGPAAADDIRKLAMAFPYNPPSTVLFQLLGWLTDAAKGVISTAEEKIKDATNTMPVGTAMALIEQGAKVFSAIHTRLHFAQARVLNLVCMIDSLHFNPEDVQASGIDGVTPEDFAENDDISPVSDPNIFSEAQRYAQLQEVFKLSADQRVNYDIYEIHRRALEMLRVPEIDSILPPRKKPQPLNPAAENVQMATGQQALAFPDQDHAAHLETHMRFFLDPYLGGSPFMVQQLTPLLVEHVKQHLGLMYAQTMDQLLSEALGVDPAQIMNDPMQAPKLDKIVAQASSLVHGRMAQQLGAVRQPIEQLLKTAQALIQPPPEDPRLIAARAADKDVARRAAKDAADIEAGEAERRQKATVDAAEIENEAHQKEADRTSKEAIELAKLDSHAQKFLLELMAGAAANVYGDQPGNGGSNAQPE